MTVRYEKNEKTKNLKSFFGKEFLLPHRGSFVTVEKFSKKKSSKDVLTH